MNLDALIDFYQTLTPESVARFDAFYAEHAYFKDPFNEVRGVSAIRRIFDHMFERLHNPRFIVTDKVMTGGTAVLIWEFSFRVERFGVGQPILMRGVSHLRFDGAGKVDYHRDYWDTAEELYMKLPLLGGVMRGLRRTFAT